ncbi:MAG: hypothetical protein K1Y02_09770 [Candidatus Hydrogenedentes bacterium]|nr:hypothetical protein [Candidatus Hydrogenedentota bacterium]
MRRMSSSLGIRVLILVAGASYALQAMATAAAPSDDPFAFDLRKLTHEEDHFGIVNGLVSAGINYKSLGDVNGLYSPPYVSSDFRLRILVDGQPIAMEGGYWQTHRVEAQRESDGVVFSSDSTLLNGRRALVVALTIEPRDGSREFSIECHVSGTLDRNTSWEFARPQSQTATTPEIADTLLTLAQGDMAVGVLPVDDGAWDATGSIWKTTVHAGKNEPARVRFIVTIGSKVEAQKSCRDILGRGVTGALDEADSEHASRVDNLPLPRFSSDNQELTDLYNRSLVHALTNRWDVPEFKLNPYYSTGSIKGGCVCNYLWNFGENWEIMPLFDPEASKTHIKQFLSIDLTKHFAFLPLTGEGFGPWYMVNQEKILGLIYYYVLITGDTAFLDEKVGDKTIFDLVLYHATVLDDTSKPVALIDYGPSNSHLELRRQYAYNHVMPDLNGRRYTNYWYAARIGEMAGKPQPQLMERAEQLKQVLNAELWDPQAKWYAFRNEKGEKELRYTCQIFKLFNSAVLTPETEAGLLSHLNTHEFLGEYGLHSLSKLDPAYDPADVDNGGPGACTCFPPQIAERLYKSGHAAEADDMIKRILWWGQKMPYWGDSIYADRQDYRKDTPLQCTFDGLTVAQCIIFGMFGIAPNADGTVVISPHRPDYLNTLSLKGLNLRGHSFSVTVKSDHFEVKEGKQVTRSPLSKPVTLPALTN